MGLKSFVGEGEKNHVPERWYKSVGYSPMLPAGTIKSLSEVSRW